MVGFDAWYNHGTHDMPAITWGFNYHPTNIGNWRAANVKSFYDGAKMPTLCFNPIKSFVGNRKVAIGVARRARMMPPWSQPAQVGDAHAWCAVY